MHRLGHFGEVYHFECVLFHDKMITISIITFILICQCIWWMHTSYSYWKKLSRIPGPKGTPFIGNLMRMKIGSVDYFGRMEDLVNYYARKTPAFKLVFGPLVIVQIVHVESAKLILNNTKNLHKGKAYAFMRPWLQEGLLTSNGHKWHLRRKLLTPTFHFKVLKDFLDVFNDQARHLLQTIDQKCGKSSSDIYPCITNCTLDIICETAMGVSVSAQGCDVASEYVTAVKRFERYYHSDVWVYVNRSIEGMTHLISRRLSNPWPFGDIIYSKTAAGKEFSQCLKISHNFTKKVIRERLEDMEFSSQQTSSEGEDVTCGTRKRKRMAFLDHLLEMAKTVEFTENDIQEEVDTFMFAGHDTTSIGICWSLYLIGRHKATQTKVQEELDGIFGESDRDITVDDLSKMKYLECVIKESHRLYPPVPAIGRHIEQDVDIGQRFAMIEEKCVLSHILRRYNVEATQSEEELNLIRAFLLRAKNGIHVKFSRRYGLGCQF